MIRDAMCLQVVLRRPRAASLSALLAALAAGPAWSAERPRIVVLDVTAVEAGAEATPQAIGRLATIATEQILTGVAALNRYEAMGSSDLTALVGLERQRQILGCPDSSTTCLAEVSAALGAARSGSDVAPAPAPRTAATCTA